MSASPLRRFINSTLRKVICQPGDMVLNAGATSGASDREGHLYRDYFPGARWMTLDLRKGADIQTDLCSRSLDPGLRQVFDLVLCVSVLEHVKDPHQAVRNLFAVVKKGGQLFVAVPFLYPEHPAKDFGDYWRFTGSGLRTLFSVLRMQEVWIREAEDCSGFCALFRKEN